MPLPTLLREGFIVPPKGMTKSAKTALADTRSIDYIMNFISDRTTIAGEEPKIPSKNLGGRVIILKSDTGSGKSTVLPPFLYEQFQERTKSNIAVTQPRVLNAIDISEGLPEFYTFLEMGINLGYNTGDYKRKPSDRGVIYMTTGILLQQLKVMDDEDLMKYYSYILIDEVHVRDINVDMVLYSIKKFLSRNYENPACPMVILMSATFDPKIFMDYFGCPKENFIQVVGSTFTIEPNFLTYDSTNYINTAVAITQKIHLENLADIIEGDSVRDVLIFVQGGGQVKKIIEQMNLFNIALAKGVAHAKREYMHIFTNDKNDKKDSTRGGADAYYVAPIELTGTSFHLSGKDYQNMFSDIDNIVFPIYKTNGEKLTDEVDRWVKPSRRIIVATNIAETGITIDSLKYCVDTGYVFSSEFNSDYGVSLLLPKNVTKGMAMQRRGRVGRKAPGFWYPCYTKKVFGELEEDQLADILNSDISENILSIIIKETDTQAVVCKKTHPHAYQKHKLSDVDFYTVKSLKPLNMSSVDFLESPSSSSLNYSVELLHALGFIDNLYNPTLMGLQAFKMRKISMNARRMIFAGYAHGANILDLITMVAFMEVGSRYIFHRKYTPINLFDKKLSEEEYEFYYKIVIGDEMIEYAMIWEYYSEYLNKLIAGKSNVFPEEIEEWCLRRKMIYDGLLYVVARRDEIIEMLITIGLDPYYNGLGMSRGEYNILNLFRTDLPTFTEEISKLKHCIMDAYRFNLCVWNNLNKSYILHYRNIPIQIRSNVTGRMGDNAIQTNPHFVIVSDMLLRSSMKNKGMYEFESTGSVSIMDTYVNIDLNFLKF